MNSADRRIWKVTFSDGAWVKMLGAGNIEAAWEQAKSEFGEFSKMEALPSTDAAAIAAKTTLKNEPSIFDVLTGTAGKDRGPVHVVIPGVQTLAEGEMDVQALKHVASELMTRILSRNPLVSPARTTVRAEVIYAINERGGLDGKSRRFIGDYLMAQFGYGGGL